MCFASPAFCNWPVASRTHRLSHMYSGSVTDVAKALGELWRAATPADKAPFIAQAEKDKVRYQHEVNALPPDLRPQTKAHKKKEQQKKKQQQKQQQKEQQKQQKQQQKEQQKQKQQQSKPASRQPKGKPSRQQSKPKPPTGPAKPKGALTAYMFFVKAKRASVLADNPGMEKSVTEAAKVTGALWRALSENEKEPYLTLAAEDKARHAREMRSYLASTQGRTASVSGGNGPPRRVVERVGNSSSAAAEQLGQGRRKR